MKKYDQLTQEQRYHISILKKTGSSLSSIADQVGCHKSTISRELKRGPFNIEVQFSEVV